MADELASLQISIQASLKDFSEKMGEFESVLKGTQETAGDTKNSFGEMAGAFITGQASLKDFSEKMGEFESVLKGTQETAGDNKNSFGEMAGAFITGQLAADAAKKVFEELKAVIVEGTKAADDNIVSMIRLKSSLGEGAEEIEKWSLAQENKTRFAKADSLEAANSLSVHKLNREEIEKLLPVIEDFAAKKGVSATQTAEAFGRAIEYGTTRGLRPFGIEVDKTGSQVDIFNALVSAGEGNVKGMAEQMGAAGLGPMVIFNNQVKEIEEEFGKKLLPEITDFVRDIGPGLLLIFGKLAEAGDLLVKFWGQVGTIVGNLWHGESIAASLEEVRVQRTVEKYKLEKDTNALFDLRAETLKKIDDLQMKPHFDKKEMVSLENEAKAYAKAISDINKASLAEGTPGASEKSKLGTTPLGEKDESGEKEKAHKRAEIIKKIKDGSFFDDENEIIEAFAGYASLHALLQDNAINYRSKHALIEGKEQAKVMSGGKNEGFEFEDTSKAESIVEGAQGRAEAPGGKTLEDKYAKEMQDMITRQNKEMAELTKSSHTKQQIDDLTTAHKLENINKVAEFEKEKHEQKIALEEQAAGAIANIANGLYELTGNKSIELFELGKAASAAQAEINGFEAATKTAGLIGGPWGVAAGILVEIACQVEVAKILSTKPPQKKAEGGLLEGPSHGQGGMMYNTEGGEYIHQRSAVQTYGTHAMDAINRGLIPPAAIHAYTGSGGSSQTSSGTGKGNQAAIHITNLQDPRMIDRHLASSEGRGSVINFMGQNKVLIRKALGI